MQGFERARIDTSPAARVRQLTVDYAMPAGEMVHALRDVDADFPKARLSVVSGPSGSGKSSLLRVLAGLQRPRSGRVEVAGVDLYRLREAQRRSLRRHRLGVVLQEPADNLLSYLAVREQVEFAARLRRGDHTDAAALLDALGLMHLADNQPRQLSGGEQQRVAFAAAAVGHPALLLADEPTAELDSEAGASMVDTMRRLAAIGITLVVSSHDDAVIDSADHVVALLNGRVTAA